jgi:hypothetical protein
MANKNNWIQGAVEHAGSFTKKAKAAGLPIAKLAAKDLSKNSKVSSKTKKQAVLAQTLAKMRKKK